MSGVIDRIAIPSRVTKCESLSFRRIAFGDRCEGGRGIREGVRDDAIYLAPAVIVRMPA